MGPSLQTFELEAWARSRCLSPADASQLRAVFEERDTLLRLLMGVLPAAEGFFRAGERPWQSVVETRALVEEIKWSKGEHADERAAAEAAERDADLYEKAQLDKLDAQKNGDHL